MALDNIEEAQIVEENTLQEEFEKSYTQEEKESFLKQSIQYSLDQNFPAFNYFELKKNYPKGIEKFNKYAESLSNKHQTGIEAIDDDTAAGILLYAPRNILFKFFDEQNIFVSVIAAEDKTFAFKLLGQGQEIETTNYPTRTLAEVDGFIGAFKLLEQSL